jgi:hypothetical protein
MPSPSSFGLTTAQLTTGVQTPDNTPSDLASVGNTSALPVEPPENASAPTSTNLGLTTAQASTGVQVPGSAPPDIAPGLAHVVALFNQFVAAGLGGQNGAPITTALSQVVSNEEQFLVKPHG